MGFERGHLADVCDYAHVGCAFKIKLLRLQSQAIRTAVLDLWVAMEKQYLIIYFLLLSAKEN